MGPYDGSLPFLIEWTTPIGPGPADGALVTSVVATPPDPERLADLLVALGLAPFRHDEQQGLSVDDPDDDDPADHGPARWSMVRDDDGSVPAARLS